MNALIELFQVNFSEVLSSSETEGKKFSDLVDQLSKKAGDKKINEETIGEFRGFLKSVLVKVDKNKNCYTKPTQEFEVDGWVPVLLNNTKKYIRWEKSDLQKLKPVDSTKLVEQDSEDETEENSDGSPLNSELVKGNKELRVLDGGGKPVDLNVNDSFSKVKSAADSQEELQQENSVNKWVKEKYSKLGSNFDWFQKSGFINDSSSNDENRDKINGSWTEFTRHFVEDKPLRIKVDNSTVLLVNKKGRKKGVWYEIAIQSPGGAPDPSGASERSQAGLVNANPEDWAHVPAHIYLFLVTNCIPVSLPKKIRDGFFENPDILGFCPSEEKLKVISAETKVKITSNKNLILAIQQARHNSRFLHEGWLVCEIDGNLHRQATELAEDYNVGVITWDRNVPGVPLVLNTPLEKATLKEDELTKVLSDWRKNAPGEPKVVAQQYCSAASRLAEQARPFSNVFEFYLQPVPPVNPLLQTVPTFGLVNLPDRVKEVLKKSKVDESEKDQMEETARLLIELFIKAFKTEFEGDRTDDFFKNLWLKVIPKSKTASDKVTKETQTGPNGAQLGSEFIKILETQLGELKMEYDAWVETLTPYEIKKEIPPGNSEKKNAA